MRVNISQFPVLNMFTSPDTILHTSAWQIIRNTRVCRSTNPWVHRQFLLEKYYNFKIQYAYTFRKYWKNILWYKYKLKTYKMQKYQSMSLNAPLSPQTLSLRRLRSRQPPPFVASVQSICQGRVGNPNVKTGKKCFDKLHFNEGVVRSTRQFCSAGTLSSSDG